MSLTVPTSATSSTISVAPGSSATVLAPTATSTSTFTTITTDGGPLITAGPFPPLTTHWNRPLSCTWTYVVDSDLAPGISDPIAYLDLEPLPGASTLSCYPDGMFFDGRTGVFSPATCPYGWTTVSVSVNTDQSADEEATTTALCCSSATIAVNTIRALFREQDKPLLGLTDDDDIDDQAEDDHGLSLSAKIGIGVGVTLFGLLAIGAAAFIYLWRRERRKRASTSRTSHELSAVQRAQRQRYSSAHTQVRARDAEPPPAYDFTTETNSVADNDSGSAVEARGGEIQVLMAQKAAIQRRIQELERASGEESRDSPREG
ncbi:hypothetical protein ACHAQJ_006784 [Trichoderma viride]